MGEIAIDPLAVGTMFTSIVNLTKRSPTSRVSSKAPSVKLASITEKVIGTVRTSPMSIVGNFAKGMTILGAVVDASDKFLIFNKLFKSKLTSLNFRELLCSSTVKSKS